MMKSLDILKSKEHLKIDIDNDEYLLEFRLNIGKGTSPIRIPIKLMNDFIDTLNIGPMKVDEKNVIDVVKNSLAVDFDGSGNELITFRTRYGRGSKIHKIYKSDYQQIIEILKEINKKIPDVISKYEDPNY